MKIIVILIEESACMSQKMKIMLASLARQDYD